MTRFHKIAIAVGAYHLTFCSILLGVLVGLRKLFGSSVDEWGGPGDISLWTLGHWMLLILEAPAVGFIRVLHNHFAASSPTFFLTIIAGILWSIIFWDYALHI